MKKSSLLILMMTVPWSCADEETTKEPLIRSVRTVVVRNGGAGQARTLSGSVRAGTESRMSFQVAGKVQKLHVRVGQVLKEGELIAELDPTDFDLQLKEAQASAAQARSQFKTASASYERVQALYEHQNASRQDLDNARTQTDSARSALSAISQTVKRLKRQLGYAKLHSPGAGTVTALSVEVNEVVSPGQVVAVVQVGQQLEVAVDVPESLINQIKRADAVEVLVGSKKTKLTGTVYEIGAPGQGATVFPVTVRLKDFDETVRSGMAAKVTFQPRTTSTKVGAPVLPLTAVGEDREGRFVYIVEQESEGLATVQRKPVDLGEILPSGVEVVSGVSSGDVVVTAGVSRIHQGLTVRWSPAERQNP